MDRGDQLSKFPKDYEVTSCAAMLTRRKMTCHEERVSGAHSASTSSPNRAGGKVGDVEVHDMVLSLRGQLGPIPLWAPRHIRLKEPVQLTQTPHF